MRGRTMAAEIQRMGPGAALAMGPDTEARVAAVFDRSFYLALPGGWVCVGDPGLGDGPLNAVLASPMAKSWPELGVVAGRPVRLCSGRLHLHPGLALGFGQARAWTPPASPAPEPARIHAGRRALARALSFWDPPHEGLAAQVLARPAARGGLQCARAPLRRLESWLAGCFEGHHHQEHPRDMEALLGLGPGLTPSGDDLLGGALITLRAIDAQAAGRLAAALRPQLAARTTPISAAHLEAAMVGWGCDRFHALLDKILAGDAAAVPACAQALARVGHCSGWDMLAGLDIVLRAYLAAHAVAAPRAVKPDFEDCLP